MVFSLHTLTLGVAGIPLEPISGSLTLDERRSPHVSARFEVVYPTNSDTLAALNARTGILAGVARADYRDPVTPAKVTAWAGPAPITPAKISAKLGTQPLSAATAAMSTWKNVFEREADVTTFSLIITDTDPDEFAGTLTITAAGLEMRLIETPRTSNGPVIPVGTPVVQVVADVLQYLNPTWALSPIDSMYETPPPTTLIAEETSWKSGVMAWDFLDAILQAHGLTLQCTPDGLWRLIRANAEPNLTRQTSQMVSARQSESRDDWGDAVLVIYRWRDAGGVEQYRSDYAALNSTPQKTVVVEHRDVPYPGPGAAAVILDRVQHLSAEITVETVSRYGFWRPGVLLAADAGTGGGGDYDGRITAVECKWPSNLMTITARS